MSCRESWGGPMSGRVRNIGGRVLTLGLSLSLLGGLLTVIPVEAAGPKPKEVEPLGQC